MQNWASRDAQAALDVIRGLSLLGRRLIVLQCKRQHPDAQVGPQTNPMYGEKRL